MECDYIFRVLRVGRRLDRNGGYLRLLDVKEASKRDLAIAKSDLRA